MIKISNNVCASITDNNIEDIIKTVEQINDMDIEYIELRLDLIENIDTHIARKLITQVNDLTDKKIILTNRSKLEGGFFTGSENERIQILVDNAELVDIVDVELFTEKELVKKVVDTSRKSIISYHNFTKTLDYESLKKIIDEALKTGDIAKIAVKPNSIEDTYIILKLLLEYENLIAISMDKIGTYTRIIAPILNSPVTYASINKQSAPGQLDINTTISMINKLKYD